MNSLLAFGIEAIADPGFSRYIAGRFVLSLKLLSQMSDEDTEILRLAGPGVTPSRGKQWPVGDYLLRVLREIGANVELFGCKSYVAPLYPNRVGLSIDPEMTNFNDIRFGRLRPCNAPQCGPDPRQQFI